MNYPKIYYANASLAAAAASAPDSLQLMTVAYTRNLPVAGAAPSVAAAPLPAAAPAGLLPLPGFSPGGAEEFPGGSQVSILP